LIEKYLSYIYDEKKKYILWGGGGVMVFNATFNNISVLSW